jgi:RNA polymerase sigma factor (sigma-70 family)
MRASGQFPATRQSIVEAIRSSDAPTRQRAFDVLVASYWKPVYKYVRLRWHASPEDAEDLTQEFFARAFEHGSLGRHDPSRARFRTFVRLLVDGLVKNARKAATRLKRGGGAVLVPLDFPGAERELADASELASQDDDALFRAEWIRSLFEVAIGRLRAECVATAKDQQFAVFERYDIEAQNARQPLTYADLAREFGVPATQITNYLAYVRRRLRHHVLDVVRELTATDREFRAEAADVLGFTEREIGDAPDPREATEASRATRPGRRAGVAASSNRSRSHTIDHHFGPKGAP